MKKKEEAIVVIEALKPFVPTVGRDVPKLRRFVLRDSNKTVAAGEILKIIV